MFYNLFWDSGKFVIYKLVLKQKVFVLHMFVTDLLAILHNRQNKIETLVMKYDIDEKMIKYYIIVIYITINRSLYDEYPRSCNSIK